MLEWYEQNLQINIEINLKWHYDKIMVLIWNLSKNPDKSTSFFLKENQKIFSDAAMVFKIWETSQIFEFSMCFSMYII